MAKKAWPRFAFCACFGVLARRFPDEEHGDGHENADCAQGVKAVAPANGGTQIAGNQQADAHPDGHAHVVKPGCKAQF